MSCNDCLFHGIRISDKMQTKTAKKETRMAHVGKRPTAIQVSKPLYNGGVSTSIAKVVISLEKSNFSGILQVSPVSLHQVINQPARSDLPVP